MEFVSNLSVYSLLPLILFILFLFKWFFFTSSSIQKNLPPSPPKLPVIGHLHHLGLLPHRSLQSLSQKYGPLMLLHFGKKPVIVASSANAAREIMKTHDLIFSNRPKCSIADRLLYGSKDIAFASYGEFWRQVRGISVLQLLSNKRVQSYHHIRDQETSEMIESIRRQCNSSSSVINLSKMFVTLTNDIIARVALGRKHSDGEDDKMTEKMIIGFGELLGVFNMADYLPMLAWVNHLNGLDAKINRIAKFIDGFMDDVLNEHSKRKQEKSQKDIADESKVPDFVDILLDVQKGNLSNVPIDRETIKAVVMDVFAAGTDTTHALMEWAMTELLRHPKILEKLQNEVRQVVQGKTEVTEDDLERMPYLKAVIKETLRLHAPVPLLVPRESTNDVNIMGYDISAGTMVIVNGWAIGRDPSSWKNPEEFQPDRFLDTNIDFRGLHFELIPFGAGRRGCPGMGFALAVNELILAKLVHKFNFTLPDGEKPEDMDMEESPGINVRKKLPLLVVASPHS